jgi:nitrate reductase NapE component
MPSSEPVPPVHGLDRVEIVLFAFGVFAIALLMVAFGQPLAGETYLPVVGVWVVGGLGFIWWFHRHLAASAKAPRTRGKVTRLRKR